MLKVTMSTIQSFPEYMLAVNAETHSQCTCGCNPLWTEKYAHTHTKTHTHTHTQTHTHTNTDTHTHKHTHTHTLG